MGHGLPGEPGADATTARPCAERVYNDPRWVSGDPCQNPAKVEEDGKWWCGTHSKAARSKRRAKQDALYEENRELDQGRVDRAHETQRRAKHYDALREALEAVLDAIADGVEDHLIAYTHERSRAITKARAVLDAAKEA